MVTARWRSVADTDAVDESPRSLLITLRVSATTRHVDAVVRAARYLFDDRDVVDEAETSGTIDAVLPVVHLWLRSFAQGSYADTDP